MTIAPLDNDKLSDEKFDNFNYFCFLCGRINLMEMCVWIRVYLDSHAISSLMIA